MGCVFGLAEMFNKYEENVQSNQLTDESLQFLTNNRRLFRNSGPTMIPEEKENHYVSEEEHVGEAALYLSSIAGSQ